MYAVLVYTTKKSIGGLLEVFRAGLRQTGPSTSLSHVIPSYWNKSILQPMTRTPSEEYVIGIENLLT